MAGSRCPSPSSPSNSASANRVLPTPERPTSRTSVRLSRSRSRVRRIPPPLLVRLPPPWWLCTAEAFHPQGMCHSHYGVQEPIAHIPAILEAVSRSLTSPRELLRHVLAPKWRCASGRRTPT